MRPLVALLATAALAAPLSAQAQSLPTPKIERAFQADPMIYDAQLKTLDPNGRFALWLTGQNLAPDDYDHPSNSGYVHLYMRGVAPNGVAGKWIGCGEDGPCKVYGATARTSISLGLDPNFYLNMPGSHLQFKLWVSQGPVSVANPEEANSLASGWSPVFTVDRAAAGVTKPVPVSEPTVITRVRPDSFELVPGRQIDWTVAIYGKRMCSGNIGVLLDGAEVARPPRCSGTDRDGTPLPGGTSMLTFELPPAYRRAGDYTLVLRASDGDSNPLHLTVKNVQITPMERPGVAPPVLQPLKPGVFRPPVKPN